jgi:hypothetical protein
MGTQSMASSFLNQPILSLSNGTMDQLQHAGTSELGNIWGGKI